MSGKSFEAADVVATYRALSAVVVLSAGGIVVGYRRGEPVLGGVDLQIEPGETVGLAGSSGCGKSTLARVLALLLAPWEGTVELDGEAVTGFRYAIPIGRRGLLRWTRRLLVSQPLS